MKKYGINHGGIWNMMSKKLKALVSVFLCALCVLASTVVCSAVSETYTLNDIDDMSVTLPDGMTAVTAAVTAATSTFRCSDLTITQLWITLKAATSICRG